MEPSAPTQPAAPRKDRARIGTSIIGIAIGILWIITFNSHPPGEGSVSAQGNVVDQEISSKGICSPIAELILDGVAYRSPPGLGAEPCEHAIGDPVEVAYHPDDVSGTLQIPYDEKGSRQVFVISLVGWLILIGNTVGLVHKIRGRRKASLNRA
ncbi:MAG TPA: hypothetical protein VLT34_01535 [Arthrobacter sp.]|nr:hypothetical protein [Arthrobacter sp.]